MLAIQTSPLIEKQAILFAVRKRMIGRRAYSDSSDTVRSFQKEKLLNRGNSEHGETPKQKIECSNARENPSS
jgi:hypothetical protein